MIKQTRFGRRLNLPSTRQIIHEMRMLEIEENRVKMDQASGRQAASAGYELPSPSEGTAETAASGDPRL